MVERLIIQFRENGSKYQRSHLFLFDQIGAILFTATLVQTQVQLQMRKMKPNPE